MGAGHDHGTSNIRHEKPLWWALGLTTAFLIAEIVGGLLTNSLALLSDAAHMGTDVLALAIALIAVRLSRRPADSRRTYGYARLEALGALFNSSLLFLVAGYILWEAWGRFSHPPTVATTGMLVVAVGGLVVNLISMRLLKAGSGENLNMKGAYLEVWSDMLGSIAVLIGARSIKFTGWGRVDPIWAVLMGLWVLPRTWTVLKEAAHVLLEGVPTGVDISKVREALLAVPGVSEVHDLHVWALASQSPAMTAHLVVENPSLALESVREAAANRIEKDFDIHHTTLQMESKICSAVACETPAPSDSLRPKADHDEHAGHAH